MTNDKASIQEYMKLSNCFNSTSNLKKNVQIEIVKSPFKVRDKFLVYSGRSPFPALSPFHPEFQGRSVQAVQGFSDFYLWIKLLI